jgi:serine carboxypeptidase-like clade 2
MFEELGPFYPQQDASGNITLAHNPYSWNLIANVVFLESPSGVGFSYSTNTSDYTVGDVRTANDTYNFLLQFFQLYPQYAKNPFWVTGESYGGHYVPMLSQRILEGNSQNGPHLNFQGFMLGNPWTEPSIDNYGVVFQLWTHALISDETFHDLLFYCDFFNTSGTYNPQDCNDSQNDASSEMGNIDPYDIYIDVCLQSTASVRQLLKHLARSESKLSAFAKLATLEDPACIDNYLTTYLNQPAVKTAIHANPSITYQICTDLQYNVGDILTSQLPVYQWLLPRDITMIVYSGDVDAVVPVPGTRMWLNELNLPILQPWRPWIGSSGQVGGYTVKYQGLTFLTIRGAGHLVPGTQPERALDFFSRLLMGKPL